MILGMKAIAAALFTIAVALLLLVGVLWVRLGPSHVCTVGGTPGVTAITWVTTDPCP
jgi:hypothetical protein